MSTHTMQGKHNRPGTGGQVSSVPAFLPLFDLPADQEAPRDKAPTHRRTDSRGNQGSKRFLGYAGPLRTSGLPANSDSVPGSPGPEASADPRKRGDLSPAADPLLPSKARSARRSGLLADRSNSEAPEDGASYPEEIAKTHTDHKADLEIACPSFFSVVGRCEHGHTFAKEIHCGREWCPVCGEKGSDAHNRRKARWYPKLQQLAAVGQLVVTIPPEVRDRYRSKKALAKFGTATKRLLQRQGISRGVRRFHFFGDQVDQEVPEYHPHLNCLIDHGYLEERKLEAIRGGLARILKVAPDRVNLHYEYTREVEKILHWIKYITRATFRDWRWDEDLARELVGFRNAATWGKWEDDPVWSIPEAPESEECSETRAIAALERSVCPCCGGKVTWVGVIHRDKLTDPRKEWDRLGGGYWIRRAERWAGG